MGARELNKNSARITGENNFQFVDIHFGKGWNKINITYTEESDIDWFSLLIVPDSLIYRSPFEILVNGIFPLESGNGVIVASPAGTYLGGEYLMSYNAIPIFKYPSSKYPNELR